MLGRLDATRTGLERDFGEYDFAHAVDRLYHLTFDDFCDWYAEAIKPRLYDGDEDARATALAALELLLKLLHPVMPHVTEEIWTNLPDRGTRLIVAPWPEGDAAYDTDRDALARVQEAAEIFRRMKFYNTGPGQNSSEGYSQRPHLLVMYKCRPSETGDAVKPSPPATSRSL